jgi:hypothetical protein
MAEPTVTSHQAELSDYLYNTNACAIKGKATYILVCLCHIPKTYSNLLETKRLVVVVVVVVCHMLKQGWMFSLVEL